MLPEQLMQNSHPSLTSGGGTDSSSSAYTYGHASGKPTEFMQMDFRSSQSVDVQVVPVGRGGVHTSSDDDDSYGHQHRMKRAGGIRDLTTPTGNNPPKMERAGASRTLGSGSNHSHSHGMPNKCNSGSGMKGSGRGRGGLLGTSRKGKKAQAQLLEDHSTDASSH